MQILVVDDDQAVRDSLARSLTYSGDQVQTAADGVEALAKLVGYTPDAIIMDVMMPRLDGLETTRMLREGGNDTPILILTARDAVGDRVDGLDAGADDYMVKPFALDELLARLRALTRRSKAPAEAESKVLTFQDVTLDTLHREVTRDGQHISTMREGQIRAMRRNFQIVFQDPYGSLSPRMTVEQIIAEGLGVHGLEPGRNRPVTPAMTPRKLA